MGQEDILEMFEGGETLNTETLAAIEEMRQAKQNLQKKVYGSFSELLQEVKADVSGQPHF